MLMSILTFRSFVTYIVKKISRLHCTEMKCQLEVPGCYSLRNFPVHSVIPRENIIIENIICTKII